MGLSETIMAAMIGAIATVTTALFQIFTAFKARGKVDVKPKRGSAMRSILAVLALMVASAAGGFLYSQLLQQRDAEDIRAMRHELRELRDLTASTIRQRDYAAADSAGNDSAIAAPPLETPVSDPGFSGLAALDGSVESVVYVPACRADAHPGEALSECQEVDAQRIALCGSIPTAARINAIQLYAQPDAVQQPWVQHVAALEADIGGARFTGKTFEYAQGSDRKAVCVNFAHWSSQHPHIARMVVLYGSGDEVESAAMPVTEPAPVLTQTTLTSEGIQALPQTAAFTPPAAAR